MKGKLFGLGVGPGDPELLTVKALRLIKESDVIAVPGNDIKKSVAYQIVKGVYEELDEKNLFSIAMPMTKDKAVLETNHEKAANDIEGYLKEHKRILSRGYEVEIVSGITSFCAVAARLNMGLVEMAEPLHIIPATYRAEEMDEILKMPGTKVLMKTGSKMQQVKESIVNSGQQAVMIENCGMPDEKIYLSAEDIPEKAGYYSLIIVKENK